MRWSDITKFEIVETKKTLGNMVNADMSPAAVTVYKDPRGGKFYQVIEKSDQYREADNGGAYGPWRRIEPRKDWFVHFRDNSRSLVEDFPEAQEIGTPPEKIMPAIPHDDKIDAYLAAITHHKRLFEQTGERKHDEFARELAQMIASDKECLITPGELV